MNQETETTVEVGSSDPEGEYATNPEWDAMNGLLRQVLSVPKEEYDKREAVYREASKAKPARKRC